MKKRKDFCFFNNLCDNEELLSEIKKAAIEPQAQTLIDAPCSSGKTYTILTQIGRMPEFDERNLVLAVPTVIQAWQCQVYGTKQHPVEVITGETGEIQKRFAVTATTYDKVSQLQRWEHLYASQTTLVIDEAHMLITERPYRERAIKNIFNVAEHIISCGGSVMYLTATPRRIAFPEFFEAIGNAGNASILRAVQTDENGNMLPKIKPKKVKVLRAPAKKDIYSCALELIKRNKEKGIRTFMLYNNKKQIDQMLEALHEAGISACRLTSDDKGFYYEEIYDNDGIFREKRKVFVSEPYGSIVEDELLNDYDAYLMTSVIEAGINCKGIKASDGSIIQPEDLMCVFVVNNSRQFDMDKIEQFLSRIRFITKEAVVLLGTPEPGKVRDNVIFNLKSFVEEAKAECNRKNSLGEEVERTKTFDGGNRKSLTTTDSEGNTVPDYIKIYDEAWCDYDRQAFYAVPLTPEIMQDRLGVLVETEYLKDIERQEKLPVELNDDTKEALNRVINDKEAFTSLRVKASPDLANKLILELEKKENGRRALRETQKLANLSHTLTQEVLSYIVPERIAGRHIYVNAEGKPAARNEAGSMDIIEHAERREFSHLAEYMSNESLYRIMKYYRHEDTKMNLRDIISDQAVKNTVKYLMETERFRLMSDLDRHELFRNTYKKLFRIAGSYSKSALKMLDKECSYINLNSFGDGSQEMRQLRTDCTKGQAEYLVLRYPEKYLVSKEGKLVWKKPGMKGTITKKEIGMIAENMGSSVKRLCRTHQKVTVYSTKMIYDHLYTIYVYKVLEKGAKASDYPEKIEIKGLRHRLHQLKIWK